MATTPNILPRPANLPNCNNAYNNDNSKGSATTAYTQQQRVTYPSNNNGGAAKGTVSYTSPTLLTTEDIPSNILKEAQTTISVAIADSLYRQSAGTTYSLKEIYECFASAFHQGGELSETFLRGDGLFEPLFLKHEDHQHLCLNWKLTRRRDAEFIVGRSLTKRQLLSATKSQKNPVSGTTLWKMYEKAHSHCLLAYQISRPYLTWTKSTDDDGKEVTVASLPPDKTEEDFIDFLLEKMFEEIELKGTNRESEDDNKEFSAFGPNRTYDKRWFFPGFWAFMLFGPLAKPESRSELLMKADPWGLVGRGKFNTTSAFGNNVSGRINNNTPTESINSATIINAATQANNALTVNMNRNTQTTNNNSVFPSFSSQYSHDLHSSSPYLLARDVPKIMKESQTTIAFAIASALYEEGHCSHQKYVFSKFHQAFHETFERGGVKFPKKEEGEEEEEGKMKTSEGEAEKVNDNGDEQYEKDSLAEDDSNNEKDGAEEYQNHNLKEEKADNQTVEPQKSIGNKDDETMMEKESKSMTDLFLSGEGAFSRLVFRDDKDNLDIRTLFSRRSVVIRMGQTITKARLVTAKQENLILGRSLFAQYERAHKNCQRAYAIWEEYDLMKGAVTRNDTKGRRKADGEDNSDEIFVTHLLDRMFEEIEIEKRKQRVNNHQLVVDLGNDDEGSAHNSRKISCYQNNDETLNGSVLQVTKKRDERWFFTGFWAFLLFGPMAPPENRSKLMENDVHSLLARKYSKENNHTQSYLLQQQQQHHQHHQQLQEHLPLTGGINNIVSQISIPGVRQKIFSSSSNSLGIIFKRSMSDEERLSLIQLAQRQDDVTSKDEELQFSTLQCQLTSLGEELKSSIEVAKVLGTDGAKPDPDHDLWKQVKDLQSQLRRKRTELDDLTQRKRRRLEEPISANSLTEAYIKSMTNGNYLARYYTNVQRSIHHD